MKIADEGRQGILFEGEKRRVFVNRGVLAGAPIDQLQSDPLPREEFTAYDDDNLQRAPRSGKLDAIVNHMGNFFDCIHSRRDPISSVEDSHRTVSTCHLANISMRLGRSLRWNPASEQCLDDDEANRWLRREQARWVRSCLVGKGSLPTEQSAPFERANEIEASLGIRRMPQRRRITRVRPSSRAPGVGPRKTTDTFSHACCSRWRTCGDCSRGWRHVNSGRLCESIIVAALRGWLRRCWDAATFQRHSIRITRDGTRRTVQYERRDQRRPIEPPVAARSWASALPVWIERWRPPRQTGSHTLRS